MPNKKITDILEAETGGKNYKAHKYSLDADNRPSVDFGSETKGNVWKKTMETTRHTNPVDLTALSKKTCTKRQPTIVIFFRWVKTCLQSRPHGICRIGNRKSH